jgi:UDP-N-acetylmuramate dehydrogenase
MRNSEKALKDSPAFEADVPLRELTTYKIGGPAKELYRPRNKLQIKRIIAHLHKTGQKFHIIGGGSNLLIADRGVTSPVLLMNEFDDSIECQGEVVRCGAGVSLQRLIEFSLAKGLSGLERLAGIPGTVGGALCMNAGAYGGEISSVLKSVEIIDEIGQVSTLSKEDIRFAYRSAPGLMGKIVISAEFHFSLGSQVDLMKIAEEILDMRLARQPLEFPSAGSVFKKHPLGAAGKFIEMAGLKGKIVGEAQISAKHANFIVNLGKARAIEVLTLMRLIQNTVFEKFKVELELEQRLLGFTEDELNCPEKFL